MQLAQLRGQREGPLAIGAPMISVPVDHDRKEIVPGSKRVDDSLPVGHADLKKMARTIGQRARKRNQNRGDVVVKCGRRDIRARCHVDAVEHHPVNHRLTIPAFFQVRNDLIHLPVHPDEDWPGRRFRGFDSGRQNVTVIHLDLKLHRAFRQGARPYGELPEFSRSHTLRLEHVPDRLPRPHQRRLFRPGLQLGLRKVHAVDPVLVPAQWRTNAFQAAGQGCPVNKHIGHAHGKIPVVAEVDQEMSPPPGQGSQ